MKNIRIIPRLDIKGTSLVKGIHLEGLRVMGSPRDFARYYYENGADELVYMDVVASLYERNSLNSIIEETAKDIFIPLMVGGGIRSIEDVTNVLRCGADKVSINTAAIKSPNIISEIAEKFGSSTLCVAIEAISDSKGNYFAYTDNGREHTDIEIVEWAKNVERLGAGEILLTSVDKEGTGEGFDNDIVNKISSELTIPVIAHGGAGKKSDVLSVINNSADAVCIASLFHYHKLSVEDETEISSLEGNLEFLNQKRKFHRHETIDILSLKEYLIENNISCRI